jgi:hypothetical protein
MDWARILAYVTGTVDQELLARNEYLAAENRNSEILRAATSEALAPITRPSQRWSGRLEMSHKIAHLSLDFSGSP